VQLTTLEIEKLKYQIAKLRRMQFGRSSERITRQIAQLEFRLEELETGEGEAAAKPDVDDRLAPDRERRKPKRKPLPDHLPRQEVVHEPENDGACTCPDCGAAMARLGEDVTEVLDHVPGRFQVIRHVRPKYACKACDAITQAPAPALLTPRGRATPAMLAHLLVSKYCDHLPLYRQSEIYAREGVELDRSTLCDWVGQAVWLLQPIVDGIRHHVFAAEKIHGDDTTVPVLAPGLGRTKTSGSGSTSETTGRSAAQPRRPPPASTVPTAAASTRRRTWQGSPASSRPTAMSGSRGSTIRRARPGPITEVACCQDAGIDLVRLDAGVSDRPNLARVRDNNASNIWPDQPFDRRAVAGRLDGYLLLRTKHLHEGDQPMIHKVDPELLPDLPGLKDCASPINATPPEHGSSRR
jgi:transposase